MDHYWTFLFYFVSILCPSCWAIQIVGDIFETGVDELNTMVLNPDDGFLYFGSYEGKIVKVDVNSNPPTVVDSSFDCGLPELSTSVIDLANNVAYFASQGVVKVDLNPSPFVASNIIGDGLGSFETSFIYGTNAYFGTDTGRIVKVDLINFSIDNPDELSAFPFSFSNSVIDRPNGFAYFGGSMNSDFTIYKVNLDTFAFEGNPLDTQLSCNAGVGVIDPFNAYALYGCFDDDIEVEQITRIDLDTLTIDSYLATPRYNQFYSSVVDDARSSGYFGREDGYIVEINLDQLSVVGAPLNSGLAAINSNPYLTLSQIDLSNRVAYFATNQNGGTDLVKVDLDAISPTPSPTPNPTPMPNNANPAGPNPGNSCGQCISTAKSTFRSDRKTCKADFRSGTTNRPEFKACKMMGKSDMYSDMATCYQSGNPCYAPAPAPAPGPSGGIQDWYLSQLDESCDTVCANNGGSCELAAINELNNEVRLEFVADVLGIDLTVVSYDRIGSNSEEPGWNIQGDILIGTDGVSSECDSMHPDTRRFCCCGPNCAYE